MTTEELVRELLCLAIEEGLVNRARDKWVHPHPDSRLPRDLRRLVDVVDAHVRQSNLACIRRVNATWEKGVGHSISYALEDLKDSGIEVGKEDLDVEQLVLEAEREG